MIGLKDLLLGATYAILKQFPDAANTFSNLIEKRENVLDEAIHISAFAHYELATIILQLNKNVRCFIWQAVKISKQFFFLCV